MTGTVQRRVYQADRRTTIIFTEVMGARNKAGVGMTLSIKSDELAETVRVPPMFGMALEKAIKSIAGKRAS